MIDVSNNERRGVMKKKQGIRKMIKTVLLIAAIAAVLCAGFFTVRDLIRKHHAPLTVYQYSYGGDMNGSSRKTRIQKLDDETAMVTFSQADWHFQDPQVSEYIVSASVLPQIEEIFDKTGMYRYNDLPMSRFFALDAGTDSYYFRYEDYESVSFSGNNRIPRRGRNALREISGIISDAVKTGQKLPGLVQEKIPDDEMIDTVTGADGKITIRVFGYEEKELRYRIHNGTEQAIDLEGNVEVYRLDGESRTLIAESGNFDGVFHVSGPHFTDDYITLSERLEEGRYLICLDGIESEFEIAVTEDDEAK